MSRKRIERNYDDDGNLISKKCTKCGQIKNINEFYKDKSKSDGLQSKCNICSKRKMKESYESNEGYYKEYSKKRYEDNKKNILKRKKKYYEDNKDNIKNYHRIYYKNNRKKISEKNKDRYWNRGGKERISKYNKEHREEKNERRRYRYRNDENYKSRRRIKDSERRAIKKGIRGNYTKEQWKQCLEYFDYKDAYTGLPMNIESVDHIIPINKNGTNTIENLVPCEKSVNSTKQDKDLWEWYSKQNYFSWERYLKICMWIIKNL